MRISKLALISKKKEKIALTFLIAVLLLSGIAIANAATVVEILSPTEGAPVYKEPGQDVSVTLTFTADAVDEVVTIIVFNAAKTIGFTIDELGGKIAGNVYQLTRIVQLADNAPDGFYNVHVEVAGLYTATDTELEAVIIDTVVPVISDPEPDAWASVADPTISATITDATPSSGIDEDTIAMTLDSLPILDFVYVSGAFSFSAAGLTEGPHSVTVDVSDMAGNPAETASWSFSVDTIEPSVEIDLPVITPTKVAKQTITGTYVEENLKDIVVGGVVALIDTPGLGEWTAVDVPLSEGLNSIEAVATDLAGNEVTDSADIFLDTAAPVISDPEPDAWASVADPTISAKITDATPSSGIDETTIIMTLDGPPIPHVYDPVTGVVSFGAMGLDEVAHSVTVDVSDLAGNQATLAWSFIVDLFPPQVTIDSVDTPTKFDEQTITGTYVEENLKDIVVGGVVALIDTPGLGEWTAVDVPLSEGLNSIEAVATALSGNKGTDSANIFLDTVVPVISDPEPDAWASVADPTISAKINDAESGIDLTTILMKLNSLPVVHIYDPVTGVVSFGATGLGEVAHSVTVDVSDLAGNSATQLAWSFSVDLTDPVVTIYGVNTPTKVATQTMAGTYLEDHLKNIVVGGVMADIDTPGTGEWTAYNVPLPLEGLNTIEAVATDLAGNTGTDSAEIFLDKVAPVIGIPSPVGWVTVDDPTISAVISDASPSSGIDGIVMKLDNVQVSHTYLAGVVSYDATGLAEGAHSVTVDVSDLAGNAATQLTWSFSVDTINPVVTIDEVDTPTNIPTQTITGTYTEDNIDTILVETVQADFSVGTWSAVIALDEGLNTITVVATDLAGNTGEAGTSISVDSVIPMITPLTPVPGSFTNDATPLISAGLFDDTSGIDVGTVMMTVDGVPIIPTIDGVVDTLEWDNAVTIPVAMGMGTVKVLATTDYLYVLIDVLDDTDARLGENIHGNDQTSVNINPTDGAPWGMPCDIIFQMGADPAAWGGVSSGVTDGWETDWKIDGVKQLELPLDLETMTIYDYGLSKRISEWKIPLASITPSLLLGDSLKLAGAIDVGDGSSYVYPIDLDPMWSDASTYADLMLADIVITDTFVSYTPEVDLSEGSHEVTVDVSDNAGNPATRTWFFNIDLTDPIVTIDGVDTPTNVDVQTITGTYTEDNLEGIVVGGVVALIDLPTAGRWTAVDVPLSEGSNNIIALATDLAGNTGEASTTIVLDTVDPVISDPSPEGWVKVADLTISAVITDADSGINEETIVMKLDDVTVVHDYDTGTGVVSFGATGLGEGPHSVTIDVSDNAGNPATRTWFFNVDLTNPVVTIDPVNTPTNELVQTITGTYVEANLDKVEVDGMVADLDNPSAGKWTAVDVPLKLEGLNMITAVATDLASNTGQATTWIFRDTVAPTAPPNLDAVSKPLRIELDWSDASDPGHPVTGSGVAGYNIYRSTTSPVDPTPGNLLVSVVATEYLDEDFDPVADEGVTFYYMVTAVDEAGNEGGPSEADATYFTEIKSIQYEIDLWPGWNMISLPLIPENSAIEAVLGEVIGDVDVVWSYDPTAAPADQWTFYKPGELGDLDKMVDGKGYWIYMTDWATILGEGYEMVPVALPPEYPIYEGWNLIGFKTYDLDDNDFIDMEDGMCGYAYFNSYFAEHYGSFWQMMDPESSIWNLIPQEGVISYDADFAEFGFRYLEECLIPGEGYWLYVTKDGTIVPPPEDYQNGI